MNGMYFEWRARQYDLGVKDDLPQPFLKETFLHRNRPHYRHAQRNLIYISEHKKYTLACLSIKAFARVILWKCSDRLKHSNTPLPHIQFRKKPSISATFAANLRVLPQLGYFCQPSSGWRSSILPEKLWKERSKCNEKHILISKWAKQAPRRCPVLFLSSPCQALFSFPSPYQLGWQRFSPAMIFRDLRLV